MAKELIFSVPEVFAQVAHAKAAPRHHPIYGEVNPTPALWLVHDEGIYLMSNGDPMFASRSGGGCVVAYARGCDPRRGDVGEHCRDLVGGDGFCLRLPLDAFEEAAEAGAQVLRLRVDRGGVDVRYSPRTARVGARKERP